VRSTDGGQTWASVFVPESEASTQPFLAGIDPLNADRVYVRLNGAPGRLFVSDDGGVTFTKVLETRGFLRAFDLSADGTYALVGGDVDGLLRLDTATLVAEPHSTVAARCVNIDGPRVFACGTPAVDGFSAGVSADGGVTFEPLFVQTCLKGPLACAAETPVGDLCPAAWPMVQELLGATGCDGGGGASAASSDVSGPAASAAASTGAGTGGAAADSLEPGGGCRCSDATLGGDGRWLLWLGLAALGRRGTRRA